MAGQGKAGCMLILFVLLYRTSVLCTSSDAPLLFPGIIFYFIPRVQAVRGSQINKLIFKKREVSRRSD